MHSDLAQFPEEQLPDRYDNGFIDGVGILKHVKTTGAELFRVLFPVVVLSSIFKRLAGIMPKLLVVDLRYLYPALRARQGCYSPFALPKVPFVAPVDRAPWLAATLAAHRLARRVPLSVPAPHGNHRRATVPRRPRDWGCL